MSRGMVYPVYPLNVCTPLMLAADELSVLHLCPCEILAKRWRRWKNRGFSGDASAGLAHSPRDAIPPSKIPPYCASESQRPLLVPNGVNSCEVQRRPCVQESKTVIRGVSASIGGIEKGGYMGVWSQENGHWRGLPSNAPRHSRSASSALFDSDGAKRMVRMVPHGMQ